MAKALPAYRAKRNFSKTPEPAGGAEIRDAEYPRFVIQKHDATRLHYDLRLEVDGVFKSWAVTRGPSLNPQDKRLAVEVEDHPLEYGDFEGTIPEGEYGGGTVMIWDRGFWSPAGTQSAEEALLAGELKFVAGGEKFKGEWVLVRMKPKPADTRANWLLIKHRDEWAKPGHRDELLKEDRSVASGRTMNEIAAGKGKGPKPFMLATSKSAKARAVWSTKTRAQTANVDAPEKRPRPRLPQSLTPVRANSTAVQGVNISSPQKLLWQGRDPITKLELAEYIATVGPWMLPHLAGIPCSVVRAPDGIEKETFFQRHATAGMDKSVGTVTVAGDRQPYIVFDDVRSLIAMAQLAAVEFHPWNCAPYQPEVPGRLIFDLDPAPDVDFRAVITAAKELRERLSECGLASFCKTTGGKGLHVVAPLASEGTSGPGWREAKMFAQALSMQMAGDSPHLYLTKMTKAARKGRIFIDYLRNDRLATAVAPLSPRARAGAAVSMPLDWWQVRAGLDPSRFTIRTAPALIGKSQPWSDYFAPAHKLTSAIKTLVGGSA